MDIQSGGFHNLEKLWIGLNEQWSALVLFLGPVWTWKGAGGICFDYYCTKFNFGGTNQIANETLCNV